MKRTPVKPIAYPTYGSPRHTKYFLSERPLELEKPTDKFHGLFWENSLCMWKRIGATMYQWSTNNALGTPGVGANSIGTLAEGLWRVCEIPPTTGCLRLRPWLLIMFDQMANIYPINLAQKVYPCLIYEYFVWVIMTIWWLSWHPKSEACVACKIHSKFRWRKVSSYCILTDVTMAPTVLLLFTLQATNISPPKVSLKMIFLFPGWDMLVPWGVLSHVLVSMLVGCTYCRFPEFVSAGHPAKVREWWRKKQCRGPDLDLLSTWRIGRSHWGHSKLLLWPTFEKTTLNQGW